MMTPNEIVEAMCKDEEIALFIPTQEKLERRKIDQISRCSGGVIVVNASVWSNIELKYLFKIDDPSISQYFKYKGNMTEIIDFCHESVKEYGDENK